MPSSPSSACPSVLVFLQVLGVTVVLAFGARLSLFVRYVLSIGACQMLNTTACLNAYATTGEILPQAACKAYGIAIGARAAFMVRMTRCIQHQSVHSKWHVF